MSRKRHEGEQHLFDADEYYIEPDVEEDSFEWVPPPVVHRFGANQLACLVHPGAVVDPSAGRRGMVTRYAAPGDRTAIIRIRDAQKLVATPVHPDAPDRVFQVTVRHRTASGKLAAEWKAFMARQYDWYGYAWANVVEGELDLQCAVILDVRRFVEDIENRPGIKVRNQREKSWTFRSGRGERFYAFDMRLLRPEVVVRTERLRIPFREPDPELALEGV